MPAQIVNDLIDLFPDTIDVTRITRDAWGEETVGETLDPQPRARIVGQVVEVMGANGQVVKSTQHVVLAGVFEVTVLDRFTLPARYSPRQPKAVAVRLSTDENGPHHETVYF